MPKTSFLSLWKQKALIKKARDDISLTENLRRLQVFRTDIPPKRSVGCPWCVLHLESLLRRQRLYDETERGGWIGVRKSVDPWYFLVQIRRSTAIFVQIDIRIRVTWRLFVVQFSSNRVYMLFVMTTVFFLTKMFHLYHYLFMESKKLYLKSVMLSFSAW